MSKQTETYNILKFVIQTGLKQLKSFWLVQKSEETLVQRVNSRNINFIENEHVD